MLDLSKFQADGTETCFHGRHLGPEVRARCHALAVALMQRVASIWDDCVQSPGDRVWITHAGVIRAATLIAQGVRQVSRGRQWPRDVLAFGECRKLLA